ncbi:MAG: glycosyltransferase family 39 protein [Candidatus Obscuribacterales bacterium]|nr:glycosyltransferase family 39 protein [Candidatus Obscuribacterales bacterium]
MQTLKSTDSNRLTDIKEQSTSANPLNLLLVSLVVALTVWAYMPVLFNFFLGDDFVHLTWLKDAVKNHELIWRNFHSSWLDGTTTRFYRPLISIFMVTDYLGWGPNGLGFHITNLLFHLTATVFLFFTSRILLAQARWTDDAAPDEKKSVSISMWLYPLAVSLIFGLYPLHTEAVSWITGRVDAVVTAFYVATFYFYLRWRHNGNPLWIAPCVASLTLGLLSKEMALTLPPAFILYELTLGKNAIFRKSLDKNRFLSWSWQIVKPTALFWSMLVVYFGVRRYALGTFVGGYDDSLFFIADLKHFFLSWMHGLRMFLIPLNKGLMGAHHNVTRMWELSLALSGVMLSINLVLEKKLSRLFVFNLLFLGLCFAPVYKIFTIADDLQGARLAHVATVALSLLLAMAAIVPSTQKLKAAATPALRFALCAFFSSACFAALWTNNQAWATAGRESNSIRQGLSTLYKSIEGDPQVLLLSLPDQIDGAYICRNAVWGMTKAPQLERDAWNCLMLNKYEQIMPFGYLRDSLYQAKDDVKIFFWNTNKKEFQPVVIESTQENSAAFAGAALKDVLSIKNGTGSWERNGSLEIRGDNSKEGKPELILNLGNRSAFDIEFVSMKVRNLDTTGGSLPQLSEGADLLYANDVSPVFSLPNRTHADFNPEEERQELFFPLRGLPEWSLGGKSHPFKIRLPHNCHLAIDSIEIVDSDRLMPRLSFANSGYMGTKGFLHLSQKETAATVSVDATRQPGSAGIILEITRPSLLFESQNTPQPSKVTMKELKGTISGDIELKRDMFPATGMYEARPWAVDSEGRKIGVAGDHFVITVDS